MPSGLHKLSMLYPPLECAASRSQRRQTKLEEAEGELEAAYEAVTTAETELLTVREEASIGM